VASVFKGIERVAAHEAQDAVLEVAREMAVVAERRLAQHRSTGNSHIEVTSGARSDAFVSLVDENGNALAIEFGRPAGSEHGESQGVYALTTALGTDYD
jgi:hypothetical protein